MQAENGPAGLQRDALPKKALPKKKKGMAGAIPLEVVELGFG